MHQIYGDLFTVVPEKSIQALVMPVSGYVRKDGTAMVGGVSKLVQDRFPEVASKLGAKLQSSRQCDYFMSASGVDLVYLSDRPQPYRTGWKVTRSDILQSVRNKFDYYDDGVAQGLIPRWALKPTLEQLKTALYQLVSLANESKWERIAIIRPSHPLPFAEVKELMDDLLDHRFALITRQKKGY